MNSRSFLLALICAALAGCAQTALQPQTSPTALLRDALARGLAALDACEGVPRAHPTRVDLCNARARLLADVGDVAGALEDFVDLPGQP